MDEMVHENAEQIAQLYQQVQQVLDGTNICTSGDIYFFKIHNKIAELSNNTVGIVKEMNNSNIHRGVYNIYLMCELDAYNEIMQYAQQSDDNEN